MSLRPFAPFRPFRGPVIAGGGGGSDSPGTTGLRAWWPLNDTPGGTWADATGNGYDMSQVGSPTSTTGKVGNGLLSSNGNYLSLDASTWGGTSHQSDFTAGLWVRQDLAQNRGFFGQESGTQGSRAWGITRVSGLIHGTLKLDGVTLICNSDANYVNTTTVFMVVRRSGTEWSLWLDGVKQADVKTISGTEQTTSVPLRIGSTADRGDNNGMQDEAFFFVRALTDANIPWLYNSGAGRAFADL